MGSSLWLPRNRRRETFTSGSVGRAPGNRCLYPEPDCLQRPLLRRSRFRQQVKPSVRQTKDVIDMDRRTFITGASTLLVGPLGAEAQSPRTVTVGFLSSGSQ